MDLFDRDGHLTDYALDLIINGEPNEMERLEVSEHLSFCDECILRYTEKLSDISLMDMEDSVADTVMLRIKRRLRSIFVNKYGTVAVASCFAIVLWISGAFTHFNEGIDKFTRNEVVGKIEKANERNNLFNDRLTETINSMFKIEWR
ncbi:MAG: hypothetical protein IAC55_05760 [Tyzzerella sp.]|uniref:Uncharacterized protein n=1 Tax=Candidatus Fimicola merdigallinarum TaxID=2840819 RepID=A0A9D9DYG4_9FIRM|nr:hypothetical protein [Candidatus Fimicola merdigallinarum]